MNNKNETRSLPEQVDVLVVGNGPVGATMAALLGRSGVRTLVVDKSRDILLMPRAIALDNEALRILQQAGLDEDAFDKVVIPEVKMHCPLVGEFGRANTSGNLDGYPKLVTFYQPDLERAMRAQARRFPCVETRSAIELLGLAQDDSGVVATLRDAEGHEHSLRARYLVGADGASSRVRHLIGQDFQGSSYAEDWLIVDADGRQRSAIDHVEFICDHRRPTPHMPAPGGRERWEFMMRKGETRAQMEDPARIAQLLSPWIAPESLSIERKAVYRFHARCCQRFQEGRVFLVGDAAHITPPFVGQGLVAGLRDAANLAWKLAWVLQGRATPEVLDSYDQERRPHAREMIALAKLMGRLVMPSNALLALLVHGSMRLMRFIPPARRHLEELEIKPKNRFRRGLFKRTRIRRGGCGGLFPQALVRDGQNRIRLSDDLLGDGLSLVGLGVDPRSLLDAAAQRRWEASGGTFLHLGLRGQQGPDTPFAEDLCDRFLPAMPRRSVAVVRPDRILMHQGPAERAPQLVNECLGLLGN